MMLQPRVLPSALLVSAAVLVIPLPASAQEEAAALILEGQGLLQVGLDRDMHEDILKARAIFERVASADVRVPLARYYMALCDYRMGNLLLERDRKRARLHLNEAIGLLKDVVDQEPDFAEAWALLSGAYGLKIGLSPIQGIVLGPRGSRAMDRARQLAPDNPRVVLIGAIGDFFTPKMFGGSSERAMEGFLRAAALFGSAPSPVDTLLPDWGAEEVYAWIGIAHRDREEFEEARAAYMKALEVNPDYGWVKEILLKELPPPYSPH